VPSPIFLVTRASFPVDRFVISIWFVVVDGHMKHTDSSALILTISNIVVQKLWEGWSYKHRLGKKVSGNFRELNSRYQIFLWVDAHHGHRWGVQQALGDMCVLHQSVVLVLFWSDVIGTCGAWLKVLHPTYNASQPERFSVVRKRLGLGTTLKTWTNLEENVQHSLHYTVEIARSHHGRAACPALSLYDSLFSLSLIYDLSYLFDT